MCSFLYGHQTGGFPSDEIVQSPSTFDMHIMPSVIAIFSNGVADDNTFFLILSLKQSNIDRGQVVVPLLYFCLPL